MCWNGQASATLATVGFLSTSYVAIKGEDKSLWIPLGYFSLMEMLQAATYTVIDQCGLPLNQVLTLLGALHIAFQPFFLNMFSMHFIPSAVKAKISPWVYFLCSVGSLMLLIKLYPFAWAGTCNVGYEPFCGAHICSVSGNWHIAWQAPLNNVIPWANLGYYLPVFVLPILYGSWRFTLYHIVVGPSLARLLTDNINEWPAIWCLLSIGMLLVVIKTPLRQLLYVNDWWLWGQADEEAVPSVSSNSHSDPPPMSDQPTAIASDHRASSTQPNMDSAINNNGGAKGDAGPPIAPETEELPTQR